MTCTGHGAHAIERGGGTHSANKQLAVNAQCRTSNTAMALSEPEPMVQ